MTAHVVGAGPSAQGEVRVLAAVIRRDDRWLLCRRPVDKRHGGLWEFPGGKLEPGESWHDAATRELREELDVSVTSVGEPLASRLDPGSNYLIVFTPVAITGEPRAIEHTEARWVDARQLPALALAPCDAWFIATHLAR